MAAALAIWLYNNSDCDYPSDNLEQIKKYADDIRSCSYLRVVYHLDRRCVELNVRSKCTYDIHRAKMPQFVQLLNAAMQEMPALEAITYGLYGIISFAEIENDFIKPIALPPTCQTLNTNIPVGIIQKSWLTNIKHLTISCLDMEMLKSDFPVIPKITAKSNVVRSFDGSQTTTTWEEYTEFLNKFNKTDFEVDGDEIYTIEVFDPERDRCIGLSVKRQHYESIKSE